MHDKEDMMRNQRTSVALNEVLGGALLSIAALASASAQAQPSAFVSKGDSVAVIDTTTGTPADTIGPLDAKGLAAAISSDGARAYVPNGGIEGIVSVVDTATHDVDKFAVGRNPVAVALTPNDAFAYVVNSGDDTVSVIDTATNTLQRIVTVGASPSSIVMSPDGAFAYVANQGAATISIIDTTTTTVVDTVEIGARPSDLAITVDGARLYVASDSLDSVWVIDTVTREVEEPIGLLPSRKIAMSPSGAMVYVAAKGAKLIFLVDTATDSVVGSVDTTSFAGACDVGVTPDGRFLYATGGTGGAVDVIDLKTFDQSSIPNVGGCGVTMAQISAASTTEVTITVKPGADGAKPVNPRSNQKIPVAVLTTDTFDALQVDPGTVAFGPDGAAESHGRAHLEDVDGDGDVDLLFHFGVQQAGIECGDATVTLTGETYAGEVLSGTDSLRTVGCR